jgi:hypothetical protein
VKRETHEEEKNIQRGEGRGGGGEPKGLPSPPKLARMRSFQVREERFFTKSLNFKLRLI